MPGKKKWCQSKKREKEVFLKGRGSLRKREILLEVRHRNWGMILQIMDMYGWMSGDAQRLIQGH